MEILIFMIVIWYGGLFFQTLFHHRYAAHQTFEISRSTEKLFYILSWIFQGSSYLSAYGYGVMHRIHHAYADTEKDPHSPKIDKNLFKMMWKTRQVYQEINHQKVKVEERFLNNVPQWKKFDVFASSWFSRMFWVLVYATFFYFFATAWWQWLLLPIAILMAPIHGAIINWFAHIYGYVNFKVKDTSKNFLPFDFLMLGEAYHNNHHKRSNDPNFGVRWHEIDPVYLIMRVLHALKIIRIKKLKAKVSTP